MFSFQAICAVLLFGLITVSSTFTNHPLRFRRDSSSCAITEDELLVMRQTILDLYDQDQPEGLVSGCDKLIRNTVTCANSLKSSLEVKLEESDKEFNKTKTVLEQKEKKLLDELAEVPANIQEIFKNQVNELGIRIARLTDLIDKLTIDKEKYLGDLDYYEDFLNNGSKYSSRFDDDSFFETAKQCTFRRDMVGKLITTFNEIFLLVVGNPQSFQTTDCFEEIRFHLDDMNNIVAHRTGENKIESLRGTYEERSRCLRKLIDDYSTQQRQMGRQNVSVISDKLQGLRLQYTTLKEKNEELRKETIKKGVQTIVTMIRSGTKMRKAKDLFLKIRKEFPEPYEQILNRTYRCDADNIHYAMRFAQIFNRFGGYEIIVKKMKDCDHMNSPMLLIIAKTLKDKSLEPHIEKIFDGWASSIKHGNYDQISLFMRNFDHDYMDFPRLFRTVLNGDVTNVKFILNFIDSLHAYDQNKITILYDVVKENYANSAEHVIIAEWVRNKLRWIAQQPTHSAITGDLQPYLEGIKDKLPNSIRTFMFEPWVVLATKDHDRVMRSDSHDSVQFKVIKHSTENFYRFEDLRYEKSFYAENFKGAMRVRMGTANGKNYFWQLIPTDNGEFFYLKNMEHGNYLSSLEDNVQTTNYWYNNKNEWMNKADQTPSTKWMFSPFIIRNGILPDRNKG